MPYAPDCPLPTESLEKSNEDVDQDGSNNQEEDGVDAGANLGELAGVIVDALLNLNVEGAPRPIVDRRQVPRPQPRP